MEETIKDKILPMSNTTSVIKKSLPEGMILSKDVKKAINQAGSIFIMYISTIASEIAKETQGKKKRPVITPDHIVQALDDMEFRNLSSKLKKII